MKYSKNGGTPILGPIYYNLYGNEFAPDRCYGGIVDHEGRLIEALPQFQEGVLRGRMTVMLGRTPYSRVGHWPVLGALLAIGVGALFRRLSRHG